MEKIPWKDVTLLWHSGYYDGPLSGLCQVRGEKLWFECTCQEYTTNADGDRIEIRTFRIYRLTEEQLEIEEEWHELFRQHVGVHCDYQNGKRQIGAVRPQENWDKYYERAKEKPKLDLTLAAPVFTVSW